MNLTITVDDDVLLQARKRALEEGTSVNAVLREYLEHYSSSGRQQKATTHAFIALSRNGDSGRGDARWTRDELHER